MGKVQVARSLRKEETPSEQLVWEQIRNRKVWGYKFSRQHVILGFVVDFYCPELKLALEIDGKIHDTRKGYDHLRQEVIEGQGVEFLRIDAGKTENVVVQIESWIRKRRLI